MNTVIKKLFKPTAASLLGTFFAATNRSKPSLTIFCYHDITNFPSEFCTKYDLSISPKIFEFQIKFISKYFNVISPDDLITGKLPLNAAMITFDDGFRSFFTNALPILEKYNASSMVFLNFAPIKGEIFWAGLLTYLCEQGNDFYQHIVKKTQVSLEEKPLYLYCSRDVVHSFLELKGKTFKTEVDKYVGDFATIQDLESVSTNNHVYFGNHLYNHDVPLLLSDDELLESFSKNKEALERYPNYRNFFAFPFGQPGTSFSDRQVNLLLNTGAKKVFSGYPIVNSDVTASYMHRIPLASFNSTEARIWFSIKRKSGVF